MLLLSRRQNLLNRDKLNICEKVLHKGGKEYPLTYEMTL